MKAKKTVRRKKPILKEDPYAKIVILEGLVKAAQAPATEHYDRGWQHGYDSAQKAMAQSASNLGLIRNDITDALGEIRKARQPWWRRLVG